MLTQRLTIPSAKNEQGFTLVELLVVIGIIAILTAIAVPMFLSQRQKANDAAVRSDVKNVVTEIETGVIDHPGLVQIDPASNAVTVSTGGVETGNVTLSNGISISGGGNTFKTSGYQVHGHHPNGKSFQTAATALTYNTALGGFTN